MILIISLCKHKLSELEFVKPLTKVISKFKVVHYKDLEDEDLKSADKVILAGTPLKDNGYMDDLDKFDFIKTIGKPVLGICAGMQVIAKLFDSKIIKKSEIGLIRLKVKPNLLVDDNIDVYSLHNYSVIPSDKFEILAESESAVHMIRLGNIYAVLFHPEVRNYDIIKRFINN